MKRLITYSEYNTFLTCRKKHFFKYEEKLKPKAKVKNLSIGTVLHLFLETFYQEKTRTAPDRAAIAIKAANDKIAAILEEAKKNVALNEEFTEEFTKESAKINKLMEAYVPFAEVSDPQLFDTIVGTEITFEVPITTDNDRNSTKFMLAGKVDMLVEKAGALWLFETKTVKDIGSDYLKLLNMDEQINTYLYAIEKARNKRVTGVIYNLIRKVNPDSKALKSAVFQREVIMRSDRERDDYKKQIYKIALEMSNPAIYRRPSRDCSWSCSYMPICLEDTEENRSRLYETETERHSELAVNKEEEVI